MRCYRISACHAPHQRNPKPAENRTLRRARALSKREAFVASGRGRRQAAEAGADLRSKYADSPRKAPTLYRCDADGMTTGNTPRQRHPRTAENRTLRRARALRKRLSDAEWDVLSQWQPRRKVHPGIRAQTGTQFPDDAANGNRIPESKLGMGYIFRMTPQAETATRNRAVEWDMLSQWQPRRKVHSEIASQNGTRFPLHLLNSKTYAPSISKLGRRRPKRNSRRSP